MQILIASFHGISSLLGILVGLLLFFVNKNRGVNTILLSLLMILFSFHTLSLLFYYSKWILNFPFIHRITYPLTLIVYPIAYLYIRNNANNYSKILYYDWLWLIPTLLFIVFYSPFYILSSTVKQSNIQTLYAQNGLIESQREGIFPRYVFSFFRIIWFIIILFFSHLEIKKAINENKISKIVLKWLKFLGLWLTILVIVATISIFLATVLKTNHVFADMIVSLTSVLISIYLFKQPELLYGLDFENQHINITKNRILTQIKFSNKDYLSQTSKIENLDNLSVNSNEFYRIKNKLEKHFHNDKPYLNQNFCLDDLVRSISIPRYLISATINKEYGISFRELVNLYRIEFLLSNLDKQEWQNLTWEAISEEAGFKSRFTFIKNFKQITGMTPSEYNKFKP